MSYSGGRSMNRDLTYSWADPPTLPTDPVPQVPDKDILEII